MTKNLWRRFGLGLLSLWVLLNFGAGVYPARAAVDLLYFIAEQQSDRVILRWETASELDNAGFYINRRRQSESNFRRISAFIPPMGDSTGEQYEFHDLDVLNGVTYFYILEIVNTSGSSAFTDPITVIFGVTTPTATTTSTPTGATPSPTLTATGDTATPTFTSRPGTATPTRTLVPRLPTSTLRPTFTRVVSPSPTNSLTPTVTATPTWTATFIPLPKFTLLFPALSPTSTRTRRPTLTPTQPLPTDTGSPGEDSTRFRLGILGGIILLLWLLLGGFLIAYLRRLGY